MVKKWGTNFLLIAQRKREIRTVNICSEFLQCWMLFMKIYSSIIAVPAHISHWGSSIWFMTHLSSVMVIKEAFVECPGGLPSKHGPSIDYCLHWAPLEKMPPHFPISTLPKVSFIVSKSPSAMWLWLKTTFLVFWTSQALGTFESLNPVSLPEFIWNTSARNYADVPTAMWSSSSTEVILGSRCTTKTVRLNQTSLQRWHRVSPWNTVRLL